MKPAARLAATLPIALACCAPAAADWEYAQDGTLYAYADHTIFHADSLLNPGNRVARLAEERATVEARFNLKAERGDLRLTLRPILWVRDEHNGFGNRTRDEAYLGQWQLRLRTSDSWSASVGREVLNWGPAQFRSPSSPFYFNNGRNDPLRELSGVDAMKLAWTPNMAGTLTLAYLVGSAHEVSGWQDSWLLTTDRRGDNWAGGLVLEQTPGQGLFTGGHGRYTVNDALLLYVEAASSTRAEALQSPADPGQPFTVAARSPRRTTALLGAAWTFENGQTINAEYLHDGHGYVAAAEGAYFDRAATSPDLAGLALGAAPPLLGRDYLYLVWQSTLMDSGHYWRLMATHNFTDHGNELSGYAEYTLSDRTSLFGLAVLPIGSARQEFSSLYHSSLTAGIKVALP